MKKQLFTFGVIAMAMSLQSPLSIADSSPYAGYTLAFEDNFNGSGHEALNTNWTFEEGYKRNNEHQYYTSDAKNSFLDGNGNLVIRAYNDNSDGKHKYTSASLQSKERYHYGIWETRAKIPVGDGVWPAIWGTGEWGGNWPNGGELDIMEYYNYALHANVAYRAIGSAEWTAAWIAKSIPMSNFASDFADNFHVWRCEWCHNSLKIYVDDILLNDVNLDQTWGAGENGNWNPYREEGNKFQIWLNLALGGINGGNPESPTYPVDYVIDYTRVYTQDAIDSPLRYTIQKARKMLAESSSDTGLAAAIEAAQAKVGSTDQSTIDTALDVLELAMATSGNTSTSVVGAGSKFRLRNKGVANTWLAVGWHEDAQTGILIDKHDYPDYPTNCELVAVEGVSSAYNLKIGDNYVYRSTGDNTWSLKWASSGSSATNYLFYLENAPGDGEYYLRSVVDGKYVSPNKTDAWSWAHVYANKDISDVGDLGIWYIDDHQKASTKVTSFIPDGIQFQMKHIASGCYLSTGWVDDVHSAYIINKGQTGYYQTFELVKAPNFETTGAYNLKSNEGVYLYRSSGTSDNWTINLSVSPDLSNPYAQFYVEKMANGTYAIRCYADQKAIGTDGTYNWAKCYGNKEVDAANSAFIAEPISPIEVNRWIQLRHWDTDGTTEASVLQSDEGGVNVNKYTQVSDGKNRTEVNCSFMLVPVSNPDVFGYFNLKTRDGKYVYLDGNGYSLKVASVSADQNVTAPYLFRIEKPGDSYIVRNAQSGKLFGTDTTNKCTRQDVYGDKGEDNHPWFDVQYEVVPGIAENIPFRLRHTISGFEVATSRSGWNALILLNRNEPGYNYDNGYNFHYILEPQGDGWNIRTVDNGSDRPHYIWRDSQGTTLSTTRLDGANKMGAVYAPADGNLSEWNYVWRLVEYNDGVSGPKFMIQNRNGYDSNNDFFGPEEVMSWCHFRASQPRTYDNGGIQNYQILFQKDFTGIDRRDRHFDVNNDAKTLWHYNSKMNLSAGWHSDHGTEVWYDDNTSYHPNIRHCLMLVKDDNTSYAHDYLLVPHFINGKTLYNIVIDDKDEVNKNERYFAYRTFCPYEPAQATTQATVTITQPEVVRDHGYEVQLASVNSGLDLDPNFLFEFKDVAADQSTTGKIHTQIISEGARQYRTAKGQNNYYLGYPTEYVENVQNAPNYLHLLSDRNGEGKDGDQQYSYWQVADGGADNPLGVENVSAEKADARIIGIYDLNGRLIGTDAKALEGLRGIYVVRTTAGAYKASL